MASPDLPPGQQLLGTEKWPVVGERTAAQWDRPWTVETGGAVGKQCEWTVEALASMRQTERVVDIHCVTRWSKLSVAFGGVALTELLEATQPTVDARFVRFVAHSDRRHSTSLPLGDARDLDVLVALAVDGCPLPDEHGGPVRLVVRGRYFYKSLKWLRRIELLAEDQLGYWEAEAGYHNQADPWHEQRFVASGITKQQAAAILKDRSIEGQSIWGIQAADLDLAGLAARRAILRAADFRRCNLSGACFDAANLAGATLQDADLRNASFVGADLEGADLAGADLRGADLRGAALLGVTFAAISTNSASPAEDPTIENAARVDVHTKIDLVAMENLTPGQRRIFDRVPRF